MFCGVVRQLVHEGDVLNHTEYCQMLIEMGTSGILISGIDNEQDEHKYWRFFTQYMLYALLRLRYDHVSVVEISIRMFIE